MLRGRYGLGWMLLGWMAVALLLIGCVLLVALLARFLPLHPG
jgi:hypothetical protein